jgi:predicted site-specific integrase-resolvase
MEPEYITKTEFAKRCGVSKTLITMYIKNGLLNPVDVPCLRNMLPVAQLVKFMARNRKVGRPAKTATVTEEVQP